MDNQNDLSRLLIDVGKPLLDNGANDSLLRPRIGLGISPDGLEIGCERGERCRIGDRRGVGGIMGSNFAFDLGHAREHLVPARLKFLGHQPVGRIGGIVLAEGAIGRIARRFEIAPESFAHLIPLRAGLCRGNDGCRDGAGAHHGEDRILNRIIDPQATKGDATRLTIVHPAAAAAVARNVVFGAGVAKRQLAPAAPAGEQTRQQSVAVLWRAMMTTGGDVAAHHVADRLGLLPTDIALVGIRHQRQPIAARLAANLHADARGTIARFDSRLTIGIGAAVNRVLNHPVDGGVVRAPPNRLAILALRRQIEIMLVEPEQSLSGTAEFENFVEDQADGLLDAAIRVLLVTIAGLDEAHRRADDEFAATRLLIAGRQRTLPQQIKLVLVEAALEAEQQPIVAVTGRIDRLLIDQYGVDDAAHLDQLLPIPAVAGETRDLARRDGANLAEAYLRHHPLKAGALDTARSRTAKIVINHLDLQPAEGGQTIAHGILQRAALAVVQNLVSRRLPHVEECFALQMMRADLVRDHGWPPSSSQSGAGRHAPGSTVSSGWSALLGSPSAARTMPACPRSSSPVILRTGRFVAARGGAPLSALSGVT